MSRVLLVNCSPVRDGATAEICRLVSSFAEKEHNVKNVCIDDYSIGFCTGCRSCHKTAKCFQQDDTEKLMAEFDSAGIIICVSPSYWADVPGQFKSFIDRCTPWCNTHEPHERLESGKKGLAIALRTGTSMKECDKIIDTIKHFFGHLEIDMSGGLGLCGIENKNDVSEHIGEIRDFCEKCLRFIQ